MDLSNLANKNKGHPVKFKFQMDNKCFSISMPMQYLGDASTKSQFFCVCVHLIFKLTGCLVFYLVTVLMGEVENTHSYLQNNFTDTKVSSNQTLSKPDV